MKKNKIWSSSEQPYLATCPVSRVMHWLQKWKKKHVNSLWWKNSSFTPKDCLPFCFWIQAVLRYNASSSGRGETQNISTSLCQTPLASQGEAHWRPSWQWQTDNGWTLHISSITYRKITCLSFQGLERNKSKQWKISADVEILDKMIITSRRCLSRTNDWTD